MTNIMIAEKAANTFFHAGENLSLIPTVGILVWIVMIFTYVFKTVCEKSRKTYGDTSKQDQEQHNLFPSIENPAISRELPEKPIVEAFPQPCSTGLTTRMLPFKNNKGEIEWVLTDDVQPGRELDEFKANPDTFKTAPPLSKTVKNSKTSAILSPVTSNSSNNESIPEKKNDSSVSPQINTPSSSSSEDHKEDMEEGEVDSESGPLEHECPHCDAKFRMRGYLTRHLKKHMPQKAYQCPFREKSLYKDENDNMHQCHPSGGFSRRDTYKTHLKTRHFKFPSGTPIKGRNQSSGNCSMCGEWFENAEIWSEIHVEGAECKYLPEGFQGKSRIKNKIKKQMARLMREEKKSKLRSKKSSTFDYVSPGMGTPNVAITPLMNVAITPLMNVAITPLMNVAITPLMSNPSQYEYEDSPTQSSCSSMGPQRSAHPVFHDPFPRDTSQRSFYANSPLSDQNLVVPPLTQADDFDDEFCLDTEQMSMHIIQPILHPQEFHGGNFFRPPEYAVPNPDPTGNTFSQFIR